MNVDYTNIVLSGESPDSLIEPIKSSLKKFGNDRLIIVVPPKKESQYTRLKEKYLSVFNQVSISQANTKDVVECAFEILNFILEEKRDGNRAVSINISNSLPIYAISGYISATLSKSPVIMSTDANFVDVPLVPYCRPVRVRYEILNEIPDAGIDSQKELEVKVNKKIVNMNKKNPAKKIPLLSRSSLSQHLNTLAARGYIVRENSDSRTKSIHLTSFGKLIKQSFEVLEITHTSK